MSKQLAQDGALMIETDDSTGRIVRYSDLSRRIREPQSELCEMCLRRGSDKCGNGYTSFYHGLFSGVRSDVRCIVEIGVAGAYSLQMWHDYFPNALIVGVDNHLHVDKVKEIVGWSPRYRIVLGDQYERSTIDEVLRVVGETPIDIVIDDGSHYQCDQMRTFAMLFPHVAPGGYYAIEDLVNFGGMAPEHDWWGREGGRDARSSTSHVFWLLTQGRPFASDYLSSDENAQCAELIARAWYHYGNVEIDGTRDEDWSPAIRGGAQLTIVQRKRDGDVGQPGPGSL